MIKKQKKHKTEIDIIHEYLMSEGARELTKEEKKSDWYKNQVKQMAAEKKELKKTKTK